MLSIVQAGATSPWRLVGETYLNLVTHEYFGELGGLLNSKWRKSICFSNCDKSGKASSIKKAAVLRYWESLLSVFGFLKRMFASRLNSGEDGTTRVKAAAVA
ncbi:hypothetical protein NSU18_01605 [Paenibacillus sp. FSL H8-0048]|uniref:hypothetical protein n=1 Tax=Paenibacillus sp. FSL H8-0048 TaxID=2954508 RepID=UPI0030F99A24